MIAIFELDLGFSCFTWLCDAHAERRRALGQVKTKKEPPHDGLTCVDCHFGEPTTAQEAVQ